MNRRTYSLIAVLPSMALMAALATLGNAGDPPTRLPNHRDLPRQSSSQTQWGDYFQGPSSTLETKPGPATALKRRRASVSSRPAAVRRVSTHDARSPTAATDAGGNSIRMADHGTGGTEPPPADLPRTFEAGANSAPFGLEPPIPPRPPAAPATTTPRFAPFALQAAGSRTPNQAAGSRTPNQAAGSRTPNQAAGSRTVDQSTGRTVAGAPRAARPTAQFGAASPAAPFEVIDESGQLDVQLSRSKLLRMRVDVYRTAVVDPKICDIVQYTAREVAIIGKSHGATHVTFWFDDERTGPMTYLVRVLPDESVRKDIEHEYEVLEQMLAEHFPDSKVKLSPVADKLFVKGEARDAAEAAQILAIIRSHSGGGGGANGNGGQNGSVSGGAAARVFAVGEAGDQQRPSIQVINMLRVPGVQQVALRVKIAELNRTAARGFGMDARARIEFKTDRAGLLVQSLLNATSGNAPALLANFDGTDINLGLRTLQQHGVLRLLSEPTLVTLSGQPATFVAGGEFAVPTLVANGGPNAITTDFRAFGAIISFLPTVVDKDRIRLQVAPEFSQINDSLSVGGTPGLNVRSVSTTVEMREGQTLAIAGLLDDNMKASSTTNVPLLKSILGIRDVSRTETELLIIVTPELVHPMAPEETPPLPGFDVTEPTNHQFYWKNRIEGNPTWDHRSTVWPRLKRRYGAQGPAQTSGPFGHSTP